MAKKYDVIVVGAGPAGLLAARACGENGLDVALLEKKTDPTKLVRACGQTIVSMNEHIYNNLVKYNSRDKRISFSTEGFSFKYDGPVQANFNLLMITPAGHRIQFGDYAAQKARGEYGKVGLSFDKEALFRSMLDEAKQAHVEVFPGVRVDRVTPTVDRILVEGSNKSFEASYCIAADGCNSSVARLIGMNEGRRYYCNFIGLSSYMTGVEGPEPDQIAKTYSYMPDGAAHYYFIPRPTPSEFNILTITIDPRVNLENATRWLMEQSCVASWFKKAKTNRRFSAICNCYSPIINSYKDRVLVCGDVGSTQELEITGAMISGWKAGQAIATAAQEGKVGIEVTGIAQYDRWWKDNYINKYNHEDYMKGMTLPYVLTTADDLNNVFGLISVTLPACWNPWTGSKAMSSGMTQALEILQKTRPDLVAKLQSKARPVTEILKDITPISRPVLE